MQLMQLAGQTRLPSKTKYIEILEGFHNFIVVELLPLHLLLFVYLVSSALRIPRRFRLNRLFLKYFGR